MSKALEKSGTSQQRMWNCHSHPFKISNRHKRHFVAMSNVIPHLRAHADSKVPVRHVSSVCPVCVQCVCVSLSFKQERVDSRVSGRVSEPHSIGTTSVQSGTSHRARAGRTHGAELCPPVARWLVHLAHTSHVFVLRLPSLQSS